MENPVTWGVPLNIVLKYYQEFPPSKRLGAPEFKFTRSPQEFQANFFLKYSIPSTILSTIALVGGKKAESNAKQFNKLILKVRVLMNVFKHFVENEWLFDNQNTREMGMMLKEDEQKVFPLRCVFS